MPTSHSTSNQSHRQRLSGDAKARRSDDLSPLPEEARTAGTAGSTSGVKSERLREGLKPEAGKSAYGDKTRGAMSEKPVDADVSRTAGTHSEVCSQY